MPFANQYGSYMPSYFEGQQRTTGQPVFGQPMPYQMPQYQPIQPMQQPVQTPVQQAPAGMVGRVVGSANEITANDVPMNGSFAFFPRQDMAEIYAKSWNADGTIRTIVFKPVLEDTPDNSAHEQVKPEYDLPAETKTAFMNRFDKLEKTVDKLAQKISAPSRKKEGGEE
nr:MAG TPA: hypothetical protein [Caudoviricetes sp.]